MSFHFVSCYISYIIEQVACCAQESSEPSRPPRQLLAVTLELCKLTCKIVFQKCWYHPKISKIHTCVDDICACIVRKQLCSLRLSCFYLLNLSQFANVHLFFVLACLLYSYVVRIAWNLHMWRASV
jgi:hypothetical protein